MAELESKFSTQFSFSDFLGRNVYNSTGARVFRNASSTVSYTDREVTNELKTLTFLNCLYSCLKSCVDNFSCICFAYLSLSCCCFNKS